MCYYYVNADVIEFAVSSPLIGSNHERTALNSGMSESSG